MKNSVNRGWFSHEMEYHIELYGLGNHDGELTLTVFGEILGDELDGFCVGVFSESAFHDFEPFLTKEHIRHIKEVFYESAVKAANEKIKNDREAAMDQKFEEYRDNKLGRNL